MEPKRKRISAEDAIANIMRFVEEDEEDEEEDDGLEELYGEEELGDVELEGEGLSILSLFCIQKKLVLLSFIILYHIYHTIYNVYKLYY